MAQRESGPIPEGFSLWSKHERGNDTWYATLHHSERDFSDTIYFRYEHDITRIKTAELPIETIGGILADDMGLGKTLTVLSTILRTAKMSKSYAAEENENTARLKGTGIGSQKIFSRATLVVVPSSRT